jgi:hypothetical protein
MRQTKILSPILSASARLSSLPSAGPIAMLLLTTMTTWLPAQVRYQLEVENTWSSTTHADFPGSGAHFSFFGGATHNDQVTFWEEGQLASPGIVQMAETGGTNTLINSEVAMKINEGSAGGALSYPWWFCTLETVSTSCGTQTVEFDIDAAWPRVTLVSMLGPTPDWFVGVSALSLRENNQWLPQVVVDLRPYDGGTRSANRWQLFGPENDLPEPIRQITTESGQLIGPDSLGTMTFTLLTPQVPGDCNHDSTVDLSDAICILGVLFTGLPEFFPCGDGSPSQPGNVALIDWQPDGSVDLSDAVALLQFLFVGGDAHPLAVPGGKTEGCALVPSCEANPSCQ